MVIDPIEQRIGISGSGVGVRVRSQVSGDSYNRFTDQVLVPAEGRRSIGLTGHLA